MDIVSHAEHFLTRLVRLADDEVKLALALYYDTEWVKEVLGSAGLPDADCTMSHYLVEHRRSGTANCAKPWINAFTRCA